MHLTTNTFNNRHIWKQNI